MNNDMLSGPVNQGPYGKEGRPLKGAEKYTAWLVPGALIAAGIYFWGQIVPYLLMVVTNTLYLILAAIALAGVLYVVLDPTVRLMAWNWYKNWMRHLTKLMIKSDPIGIMKNYLIRLDSMIKYIRAELDKVRGNITSLQGYIDTDSKEKDDAAKIANSAIKRNMQNKAGLAAQKIKRREDSIAQYQALKDQLNKMLQLLLRREEEVVMKREEIADTILIEERKRKGITAGRNALKSIAAALFGDKQKELYDMALEQTLEDFNMAIGEIEGFMERTKSSSLDFELIQEGNVEEGLKLLEAYNTQNEINLPINDQFKTSARESVRSSIDYTKTMDLGSSAGASKKGKYLVD